MLRRPHAQITFNLRGAAMGAPGAKRCRIKIRENGPYLERADRLGVAAQHAHQRGALGDRRQRRRAASHPHAAAQGFPLRRRRWRTADAECTADYPRVHRGVTGTLSSTATTPPKRLPTGASSVCRAQLVSSLGGIKNKRAFLKRMSSRSMIPVSGGLRSSSAELIATIARMRSRLVF